MRWGRVQGGNEGGWEVRGVYHRSVTGGWRSGGQWRGGGGEGWAIKGEVEGRQIDSGGQTGIDAHRLRCCARGSRAACLRARAIIAHRTSAAARGSRASARIMRAPFAARHCPCSFILAYAIKK